MYIWNLYKSRIPKITPIKLAKKVFGDMAVLTRCDINTGICTCVTCWSQDYYYNRANMQPGHYVKSERSLEYRYERINVRPQCRNCNVHLDWNLVRYAQYLDRYLGVWTSDKLWNDGLKDKYQAKWKLYAQDYVDITVNAYIEQEEFCERYKLKPIREYYNKKI